MNLDDDIKQGFGMMNDNIYMIKAPPVYKSQLVIEDGAFVIKKETNKPHWWIRFWYKFLLGWRWEDI